MDKNPSFWDCFDDCIEYPPMIELISNGLKDGVRYSYVSHSFVNGMLPYVTENVRASWLLQKYRHEKSKEEDLPLTDDQIKDLVAKLNKAPHAKLDAFGDDVLLLCESEDRWFWFHLDCDVSDCEIGTLRKEGWSLDQLVERIENSFSDPDSGDGFIRAKLPTSIFRGWVQF